MYLKLGFAFSFLIATLAFAQDPGQRRAALDLSQSAEELKVNGNVALSSLMTISDQHISKLLNSLRMIAENPEVQSGEWSKIRQPLAAAAEMNVEALTWFVLPDGSDWSTQKGKESGSLKDRTYFPKLMWGERVVGELVYSKSTGKSVAIVAVPVMRNEKVIGALGASVYLDKLSALIEKEMSLNDTMIFYSFDSKPIVALDWDPMVISADPMKLGKEVSAAFKQMLQKNEGTVEYVFRGKKRKVIFKKSDVTGWWYAFGLVPEGREEPGSSSALTK